MRKSIIIYGLGNEYIKQKRFLELSYNIIGYCDSSRKNISCYIAPEKLKSFEFDYIYITSSKYLGEIRDKLINTYGIDESKIISKEDVLGDFRNAEIRHEWIKEKLQKLPEGRVVLDAGAGEQRYKPYCSHLKYISQDFGEYVPEEGDKGLHTSKWDYTGLDIKCDIIDMPLADKSVDAILCTEVFEHLKAPMLALKEFSRILRPGGVLLLTAPFCCLTHMAPYFYYNGFSEYWYRENLRENGFEIKEMVRNGNYFKYLSQELFRVNDMAIKYCHDKLKDNEIETIMNGIKLLTRLSENDLNSNETLCFGYMLVAEKIDS